MNSGEPPVLRTLALEWLMPLQVRVPDVRVRRPHGATGPPFDVAAVVHRQLAPVPRAVGPGDTVAVGGSPYMVPAMGRTGR